MPDRYDDLSEYNWLMHEIIRHESAQAIEFGNYLWNRYHPRTVLDIGCGPGVYLLPFKARGSHIFGVDGAPGSGECLDPDDHGLVDLRIPWQSDGRYDLTLCIEVAEHIKPEYADTLIETICRNTYRWVFFTGARPGQGGEGHYNEQPKEYWLEKFAKHGFELSVDHDTILDELTRNDMYHHCNWMHWNGMFLERTNV